MTFDEMRAAVAEARRRQETADPEAGIPSGSWARTEAARRAQYLRFVRHALPDAFVFVASDGTIVFALGGHRHEWGTNGTWSSVGFVS